ncbi:putative ubiquitin carboxyl-terminal hydrolase FAF-X [Cichlidogyrus casuarinus]|uniref:Ubiquitin carboxyl-terminal hydrolase FAF-X n=1 Tax=Cichlidogyrus casuarinus TaxID=1844966 RepID=A0ABD2QJS2_9PLAT
MCLYASRSSRTEKFLTLNVDVHNQNNLLESLAEYVRGERLEGGNAYRCEKCENRVQTTLKRTCIKKCPLVLTIQLKRFDFDWNKGVPIKFNDHFKFPRQLDLFPYTVDGVAPVTPCRNGQATEEELVDSGLQSGRASGMQTKGSTRYNLRGVVVHNGQASGGHYYSYVRFKENDLKHRWFRFDDSNVLERDLEDDSELAQQCFGGDFSSSTEAYNTSRKRYWSAYMLFYEREDFTAALLEEQSNLSAKGLLPVEALRRLLALNNQQENNFELASEEIPSHVNTSVHEANIKFIHGQLLRHESLQRFFLDLALPGQHLAGSLLTLLSHYVFKIGIRFEQHNCVDSDNVTKFSEIVFLQSTDVLDNFFFDCPHAQIRFMYAQLFSQVLGRLSTLSNQPVLQQIPPAFVNLVERYSEVAAKDFSQNNEQMEFIERVRSMVTLVEKYQEQPSPTLLYFLSDLFLFLLASTDLSGHGENYNYVYGYKSYYDAGSSSLSQNQMGLLMLTKSADLCFSVLASPLRFYHPGPYAQYLACLNDYCLMNMSLLLHESDMLERMLAHLTEEFAEPLGLTLSTSALTTMGGRLDSPNEWYQHEEPSVTYHSKHNSIQVKAAALTTELAESYVRRGGKSSSKLQLETLISILCSTIDGQYPEPVSAGVNSHSQLVPRSELLSWRPSQSMYFEGQGTDDDMALLQQMVIDETPPVAIGVRFLPNTLHVILLSLLLRGVEFQSTSQAYSSSDEEDGDARVQVQESTKNPYSSVQLENPSIRSWDVLFGQPFESNNFLLGYKKLEKHQCKFLHAGTVRHFEEIYSVSCEARFFLITAPILRIYYCKFFLAISTLNDMFFASLKYLCWENKAQSLKILNELSESILDTYSSYCPYAYQLFLAVAVLPDSLVASRLRFVVFDAKSSLNRCLQLFMDRDKRVENSVKLLWMLTVRSKEAREFLASQGAELRPHLLSLFKLVYQTLDSRYNYSFQPRFNELAGMLKGPAAKTANCYMPTLGNMPRPHMLQQLRMMDYLLNVCGTAVSANDQTMF